jgi:hypothetical protein
MAKADSSELVRHLRQHALEKEDGNYPTPPDTIDPTSEIGLLLSERAELVFGQTYVAPLPIRITSQEAEEPIYGVRFPNGTIAVYDDRIASFRVEVEGDWYPVFSPGDAEAARRQKFSYPKRLLRWVDKADIS